MRRAAVVAVVILIAALAAGARAASPSPKVQATRLAATDHRFMTAFKAEAASAAQVTHPAGAASHCGRDAQIPKSRQQAAVPVFLTYALIFGVEKVAPLYGTYDRELSALHLSDPPLARYALAVHRFVVRIAPLESAKPLSVCAVSANWRRAGYPEAGGADLLVTVDGLTRPQAAALASMLPASKSVVRAKAAADARLHALGVTPEPIPING